MRKISCTRTVLHHFRVHSLVSTLEAPCPPSNPALSSAENTTLLSSMSKLRVYTVEFLLYLAYLSITIRSSAFTMM